MKSDKIEKWQENLKPGTPIRVLYQNVEAYGVFVSWKDYGYGKGCLYMSIPIWADDKGKLAWLERRYWSHLDRVQTNAEDRVKPVDMQWLSEVDKTCLETLKNRIYEYKNN